MMEVKASALYELFETDVTTRKSTTDISSSFEICFFFLQIKNQGFVGFKHSQYLNRSVSRH